MLTGLALKSVERVRVLVRVVEVVGTIEKFFSKVVCLILPTEHLIVLVHDIVERGFVHVLVESVTIMDAISVEGCLGQD